MSEVINEDGIFKNAIDKLNADGILFDLNSSNLNPKFFKFDFNNKFNEISVIKVMEEFNKYYAKENNYTYLDVIKAVNSVDSVEINNYYLYKEHIVNNDKIDYDIDVLTAELLVYIDVYNQLSKDITSADFSSEYEKIKQIMINNLFFSDGAILYQYEIQKSKFNPIDKDSDFNEVLNVKLDSTDVKKYYENLTYDLIKIGDLIIKFNYYYQYEELFDKKGDYENIKNLIKKLK